MQELMVAVKIYRLLINNLMKPWTESKKGAYTEAVGRVNEEDAEVDGLEDDANAVDGGDEYGAGVHHRKAVEHPEHAVQQRHEVRKRREVLHGLPLPHRHKCWPEQIRAINDQAVPVRLLYAITSI